MTQPVNSGDPNPYSVQASDEHLWRRPDGAASRSGTAPASSSTRPDATGPPAVYTGPPRSAPPPAGWRPPVLIQAPQARPLPAQDLDAIDREERQAAVTTYGIGLVAGAIALLILVVLCGRLIL